MDSHVLIGLWLLNVMGWTGFYFEVSEKGGEMNRNTQHSDIYLQKPPHKKTLFGWRITNNPKETHWSKKIKLKSVRLLLKGVDLKNKEGKKPRLWVWCETCAHAHTHSLRRIKEEKDWRASCALSRTQNRKVLLRHMCPDVIYERAPGRMPQRGPLHAAWLWVLCVNPSSDRLGLGIHTRASYTNEAQRENIYIYIKKNPVPSPPLRVRRSELAARLTLQKAR